MKTTTSAKRFTGKLTFLENILSRETKVLLLRFVLILSSGTKVSQLSNSYFSTEDVLRFLLFLDAF